MLVITPIPAVQSRYSDYHRPSGFEAFANAVAQAEAEYAEARARAEVARRREEARQELARRDEQERLRRALLRVVEEPTTLSWESVLYATEEPTLSLEYITTQVPLRQTNSRALLAAAAHEREQQAARAAVAVSRNREIEHQRIMALALVRQQHLQEERERQLARQRAEAERRLETKRRAEAEARQQQQLRALVGSFYDLLVGAAPQQEITQRSGIPEPLRPRHHHHHHHDRREDSRTAPQVNVLPPSRVSSVPAEFTFEVPAATQPPVVDRKGKGREAPAIPFPSWTRVPPSKQVPSTPSELKEGLETRLSRESDPEVRAALQGLLSKLSRPAPSSNTPITNTPSATAPASQAAPEPSSLKERLESRLSQETDPEVREALLSLIAKYNTIPSAPSAQPIPVSTQPQARQPSPQPVVEQESQSDSDTLRGRLQNRQRSESDVDVQEAITSLLSKVFGVEPPHHTETKQETSVPTTKREEKKEETANTETSQFQQGATELHRTPALSPVVAKRLLELFHSRRARKLSLSTIDQIEQSLRSLESSFVFPPSLDLSESSTPVSPPKVGDSEFGLAYTPQNRPIHTYENALNSLLMKLDEIESQGDENVRGRRKEVVNEVERALRKLLSQIEESRERASLAEKKEGDVKSETKEDVLPPLGVEEVAKVGEQVDEAPIVEKQPEEVPTIAVESSPTDIAQSAEHPDAVAEVEPTVEPASSEPVETNTLAEPSVESKVVDHNLSSPSAVETEAVLSSSDLPVEESAPVIDTAAEPEASPIDEASPSVTEVPAVVAPEVEAPIAPPEGNTSSVPEIHVDTHLPPAPVTTTNSTSVDDEEFRTAVSEQTELKTSVPSETVLDEESIPPVVAQDPVVSESQPEVVQTVTPSEEAFQPPTIPVEAPLQPVEDSSPTSNLEIPSSSELTSPSISSVVSDHISDTESESFLLQTSPLPDTRQKKATVVSEDEDDIEIVTKPEAHGSEEEHEKDDWSEVEA
ncbi:hypothetical protein C8Q75DRAFT_759120 [Abortiporus biennis]|nr:hypothetical protein C8Q75DRAFT_759120 [Abortiporus biennis]